MGLLKVTGYLLVILHGEAMAHERFDDLPIKVGDFHSYLRRLQYREATMSRLSHA